MGKIHKIKFKGKDLCDAVHDGRKTYEIRKNDRDYQVGDVIRCTPIDEDLNPIDHPISEDVFEITYLSSNWQGVLLDGYCVFAIKLIGHSIKVPIEV